MIIKIIPEENESIKEVEHHNVKDFFMFGNKLDNDERLIDFHDWSGQYRYLISNISHFLEEVKAEKDHKDLSKFLSGFMSEYLSKHLNSNAIKNEVPTEFASPPPVSHPSVMNKDDGQGMRKTGQISQTGQSGPTRPSGRPLLKVIDTGDIGIAPVAPVTPVDSPVIEVVNIPSETAEDEIIEAVEKVENPSIENAENPSIIADTKDIKK